MMTRGGSLLEIQVSDYETGLEYWEEYYELTEQQIALLEKLYHLKIENHSQVITLSPLDIQALDASDREGVEEGRISFAEIGFNWSGSERI